MKQKSSYCTIYLIRHGETEWNVQHRIQGHQDSPLTPKGKLQAKQIAQALKHVKFAAMYSSDLGRAQETARIIALQHKLVILSSQLLRERYLGRLEGKKWIEGNTRLKHLLAAQETLADPDRFKHKFFPEMENDEEAITRALTLLREISLAYINKNVLVVTHGGVMRALLIHLGFGTYQELPNGVVTNSAHIVLRSDGTEFFIDQTVGITKKTVSN